MLEQLQIRDLGPIHEALLAPAPGMTAITGETGAGKSMLLSAVHMISGGPAESTKVSANRPEAWAQGVFAVESGSAAALIASEAGVDAAADEDELFLSRTVPASGRSRATLSGRSVPRTVLERLSNELVTIHGQSDQLRIAAPARQRDFLDMVSGDEHELAAYRQAWSALSGMDERLDRLRRQEASAHTRADYLRESVDLINRVDPQPGEEGELKDRRTRIEHATEIAHGVGEALQALDASQAEADDDRLGAVELVNLAVQSLRSVHVQGVFDDTAERLESIGADLSDVVFALSGHVETEAAGEDLDAINSRIYELSELTRRWGPELSDVIAWRDKAVFEMEDLDASPEKLAQLTQERSRLFDEACEAARALSAARSSAAAALSAQVRRELASLSMAGADLEIRVSPRGTADRISPDEKEGDRESSTATGSLDAHGMDDIEFLFTPFPGSPELPMGKSASGGELSRLMLALELSAAQQRPSRSAMTFIFDEIDAGVGGKAAVELGRRLARLARSAQVIVVTHLAQVASWADAQFVVSKGAADDERGGVATVVAQVNGEERVHEIARMLSGSESETSLEHARELLESSAL